MASPVADFRGAIRDCIGLMACFIPSYMPYKLPVSAQYVTAQLKPKSFAQRLEICWTLLRAALSIWSVLSLGKFNNNGYLILHLIFNSSKHWHQLDLVLTLCTNLGNVKLTLSYQSADCDTDHSLVCCKVNFKVRKVHHAKREGRHCINTCMTRRPENWSSSECLRRFCPAQPIQAQLRDGNTSELPSTMLLH